MNSREFNFENLPLFVGLIFKDVEEIKKMLTSNMPRSEPDIKRLSINEAVKFLLEKGFPVSKSKLYKLTSEGKIPFEKFGMRVLFKQDKLIDWIENEMNLSTKTDSKYVMTLANSARKKINKKNIKHGK
ncbi:MAG TPA: helix-turn-helix domain-containing protein [Flavobacterium sp.]|uniref:helix-turn-helix domain-containing protein n=1 Tax=Flavobacterium sp. TaxID=239 RepID=UPI002DB7C722|nr:helix-turn-helix domain-containing protein [Flavobacterium sp.]HEU4790074.1 helix-turn-helix domain-containing protein [Flavobacterium sp.]